jgi:endonuclease/exonuclease/phosphatase family metal-dependent hydrolase
MFRFLKTSLLLLVVIAGVWLLLNKDQISQPQDVIRLARQKLESMQTDPSQIGPPVLAPWSYSNDPRSTWGGRGQPGSRSVQPTSHPYNGAKPHAQRAPMIQAGHRKRRTSIRIASMMVDSPNGRSDESASLILADICRRYDIVALQGIKSSGASSAMSLVDSMNSMEQSQNAGPRPSYRALIDQAQSVAGSKPTQLAIIFDEAAVTLDNDRWYQVRDPEGILVHKPMVAWFRARGVPTDQAFTFSLANVQLDSRRPDRELRYLSELFRAVRDDGRGEDDVILAGNFNSGDRGLAPIQEKSGLTWVISGKPTNTDRTAQFDNIVFNPAATVEFTQRGGVFDFMKHYNLRLANAQQISTHLPVWAEFNLREGQRASSVESGRTARK